MSAAAAEDLFGGDGGEYEAEYDDQEEDEEEDDDVDGGGGHDGGGGGEYDDDEDDDVDGDDDDGDGGGRDDDDDGDALKPQYAMLAAVMDKAEKRLAGYKKARDTKNYDKLHRRIRTLAFWLLAMDRVVTKKGVIASRTGEFNVVEAFREVLKEEAIPDPHVIEALQHFVRHAGDVHVLVSEGRISPEMIDLYKLCGPERGGNTGGRADDMLPFRDMMTDILTSKGIDPWALISDSESFAYLVRLEGEELAQALADLQDTKKSNLVDRGDQPLGKPYALLVFDPRQAIEALLSTDKTEMLIEVKMRYRVGKKDDTILSFALTTSHRSQLYSYALDGAGPWTVLTHLNVATNAEFRRMLDFLGWHMPWYVGVVPRNLCI
eukprot:g701.t1